MTKHTPFIFGKGKGLPKREGKAAKPVKRAAEGGFQKAGVSRTSPPRRPGPVIRGTLTAKQAPSPVATARPRSSALLNKFQTPPTLPPRRPKPRRV